MKWTLIGAVTVASVIVCVSAAQADRLLRIGLQVPPTHLLARNVEAFKTELEARTNGTLKVEIYPSSQLFKDYEGAQAVSSGVVDIGVVSLPQIAGFVPAAQIFDVPFLFENYEEVIEATAPDSPVRSPIDEAIADTGARTLWWQAYGSAIVISDTPVRVPEDMKGKKIRTFGKMASLTVEALGGAPTLVSGSEQFLAYQRGVVDGGMTGVTSVMSRKLYEVMPNMTLANVAIVEFVVLMNDGVWQSLSDSEKAAVTEAARKVERDLRTSIAAEEREAIEFLRTETDLNIIDLSAEEVGLWREATEEVVNAFLAETGDLGQKLYDAARN